MHNVDTLINGHIIWSRSTYSEKIEHNEKIRHSKFFSWSCTSGPWHQCLSSQFDAFSYL